MLNAVTLFKFLTVLHGSFYFPVLSGWGTGAGGSGGSGLGEERSAVVQTLPSPYSKITAPRKPHRCSSGHASDNRYELKLIEMFSYFLNIQFFYCTFDCDLILPPTAVY